MYFIGKYIYLQVYVLNEKANKQRLVTTEKWFTYGGILLMGYEMFRTLAQGKKLKKKEMKDSFARHLLDPGPDIIVCDEGHVLRQANSNLSLIVNQVVTKRRIVLTGTPLQNNLRECKMILIYRTIVFMYVCRLYNGQFR